MSGLNTTEKQLLRVASYEASWLAGNAIAEATRMKKVDLFRETLTNYQNIVITLDIEELATRCDSSSVRDSHVIIFRQLMKQHVKEGK